MKKNAFIIYSLLVIIMTSCSIQKKQYSNGYYVDWKTKKTKPQKTPVVQQEDMALKQIVLPKESIKSEFKAEILASIEHKPTILTRKSVYTGGLLINKSSFINKETSVIKKTALRLKKSSEHKLDTGVRALLIVLGILFVILGGYVLWYISIPIGVILILLAITAFIFAGLKNKKENESEKKKESTYDDVVYLKNGSIIRGIIIEQIPGVSLKIQTKDKNVFVYKMDEILKMTKELSGN